ncbi:hypothetical protein NE237_017627 [Protea cynaroides]|uniref:F-box domain-containing protein n=1 Tax=Protea cynaroides TaxID=273540 RepID=A0A9Q0K8E5_9MAGN|nr:hypothetical protein NE237_017627 [Protea cynaroides]
MNLPKDIIFEIWSRLPIESFLRCRSVCKLWYNWGYETIHQLPHLVLAVQPEASLPLHDDNKKSSLLMMNVEGDHCKTRQIPLGFQLFERLLFDIVGSCNGFLCLCLPLPVYNCPIYLYNPITKEATLLPRSHLTPSLSRTVGLSTTVGFGFDRLDNKYKVVRVHEIPYIESDDEGEDCKKFNTLSEIITVDANAFWRKLDFPRAVRTYKGVHPVFLDGILYWLCDNILALDIHSEKHWTIECPPLKHSSTKRKSLIHIDGSLAIIDYNYHSPMSIDIWLLKGSKTMGFSFSLTTYDMSRVLYPQAGSGDFLVIAKLSHDTFLLELRSDQPILMNRSNQVHDYSIVLYSSITQQYLSVQGTWKKSMFQRHWMVPTLKSLNAEIDINSWTDEEDRLLVRLVTQYSARTWAQIAHRLVIENWIRFGKYVQAVRTGGQCRERWHNHLCFSFLSFSLVLGELLQRSSWNEEEDEILLTEYHGVLGEQIIRD